MSQTDRVLQEYTYVRNYALDHTMLALKISQVGNSLGVVLPKDLLARLKVGKGDVLFLTEAPDGWRVTPYDPAIEQQLAAGREFMHEFRDTFHQLAK